MNGVSGLMRANDPKKEEGGILAHPAPFESSDSLINATGSSGFAGRYPHLQLPNRKKNRDGDTARWRQPGHGGHVIITMDASVSFSISS